MKKILSVLLALVALLSFSTVAYAEVVIDTDVPTSHSIVVNYNNKGSVTLNGTAVSSGEETVVSRGTQAVLIFNPSNGCMVGSVTVNGVDFTASVVNNKLVIENVNADAVINVDFVKDTNTKPDNTTTKPVTDNGDKGAVKNTSAKSPKTGNDFVIYLSVFGLIFGVATVVSMAKSKRKVKNN